LINSEASGTGEKYCSNQGNTKTSNAMARPENMEIISRLT